MEIVIYIFLFSVVCFFMLLRYVDFQLAKKNFTDAYDDRRKIWSARGIYGEGVDENSIQSIAHSFSEGAMGVEVDVFYDV